MVRDSESSETDIVGWVEIGKDGLRVSWDGDNATVGVGTLHTEFDHRLLQRFLDHTLSALPESDTEIEPSSSPEEQIVWQSTIEDLMGEGELTIRGTSRGVQLVLKTARARSEGLQEQVRVFPSAAFRLFLYSAIASLNSFEERSGRRRRRR